MAELDVFEDKNNPFEGLPTTVYQYTDQDGIVVSVGAISLKNGEALAMAFHIEVGLQGKRIGRLAFQKGYEKYSAHADIKYIIGKWKVDIDFAEFENCESTNLTVFNNLLAEGLKPEEAAVLTPTGKWVTPLGFDKVKICRLDPDWVEVEFHRLIPKLMSITDEEDLDLSDYEF